MTALHCGLGVTLIAQKLGLGLSGQFITALLSLTLPAGLLQATGTQNNYILAFWLVGLVVFGLSIVDRLTTWKALSIGGSLGLAILTKGTSYFFAFPFLVWFLVACVRKHGRKTILYAIVAAIVTIGLNAPHIYRNIQIFENPFGPEKFSNETLSPKTLLSNLTRNLAIHTTTPFSPLNRSQEYLVNSLHEMMGIDIIDPRTTWPGTRFSMVFHGPDEDISGNLIHTLLFFVCLALVFTSRPQPLVIRIYLACIVSGIVLFCYLLKWQPWHTRLHLPLFVLWTPIGALALETIRKPQVKRMTCWILVLTAFYWIAKNPRRPLVGSKSIFRVPRQELYFAAQSHIFPSHLKHSEEIKRSGCKKIGLKFDEDTWEYPLWILLDNIAADKAEIRHIDVTNATSASPVIESGFEPCYLLTVESFE